MGTGIVAIVHKIWILERDAFIRAIIGFGAPARNSQRKKHAKTNKVSMDREDADLTYHEERNGSGSFGSLISCLEQCEKPVPFCSCCSAAHHWGGACANVTKTNGKSKETRSTRLVIVV